METIEKSHFESLYPAESRFKQIEQILTYVKEGKFVQVISLPGVGRSNLLRLLQYNTGVRIKHLGENQKWFHFVSVDFSEVRNKPIGQAYKLLFLTLQDSLQERKLIKEHEIVSKLLKEGLGANDDLVLFAHLKRAIDYVAIEKELTVVFLFDRFEEYVPMLTDMFFQNLRTISNRAKYRFAVVFSLTHPLEQLVPQEMLTDIYSLLEQHAIYLPLQDQTSLSFRLAYIEKVVGKTVDEKLRNEIEILTGGHEKMTRIAVEEVLNNSVIQQSNNTKNLSDFLKENKAVRSVSYEIWNALLPSEQQFLTKLPSVILEGAKATDRIPDDKTADYLQKIELIKNGEITIPLFAEFVAYRASNKEADKITKLPTGEMKKGDDLLSDILTKSEYQLLSFFIDSENKIVEREEVINAVWQDSKTTVGVTDQALDQLIFRLRKKIEDDPNNPTHLQTIKGRGFKFTS